MESPGHNGLSQDMLNMPKAKHSNSVTEAEHASKFKLTKDTPYPTLICELWGVYCNDFRENWPQHHTIREELQKKEVLRHDYLPSYLSQLSC